MTEQPQKEYIITEEQLKKYEGLFFLDDDAQEDFKTIRSRPAPSPHHQSTCYLHCPTCKQTITTYCNIPTQIAQDREAAIAAQAREELLADLYTNYKRRYVEDAIDEIRHTESPRQPEPQQ